MRRTRSLVALASCRLVVVARSQKWCVVADDQVVECWLNEAQAQHRAHLLRRKRDEGRFGARSIRVTKPMRGSGFRMKPGPRFDGFTDIAGKWVLPSILAAIAGGVTAAIVLKSGEASLRAELETAGSAASVSATTSCQRAAEAQVWTTLGQYGLTPARVRALQLLVQQGEAAAAQAQTASNAVQVIARGAGGAAAGTAASAAADAAAALRRIFG